MGLRAVRSEGCLGCGFCEYLVDCAGHGVRCTGCGNCVKGCPSGVRRLVTVPDREGPAIELTVDGERHSAAPGTSLGALLGSLGRGHDPARCCGTGGCWDCAVVVDGELRRACSTSVAAGMTVTSAAAAVREFAPRRIVTLLPNHFHASVSLFTHGCNYGCDFCHNWNLAFSSADRALTPVEAVALTGRMAESGGNRRTGISGGEPTLNRPWLVEYVSRLRSAAPGVRIQLDTNASLLTPDYIDELVAAGVTDLSPDLKGLELETFQRISRVEDPVLAARYLETSWKAVEYALGRYASRLAVAVALPYHPELVGKHELSRMGERLGKLHPGLDVNLMVYQPAFRRRGAEQAPDKDIDEAVDLLEAADLTVWCQEWEHIPQAQAPEDWMAESDESF